MIYDRQKYMTATLYMHQWCQKIIRLIMTDKKYTNPTAYLLRGQVDHDRQNACRLQLYCVIVTPGSQVLMFSSCLTPTYGSIALLRADLKFSTECSSHCLAFSCPYTARSQRSDIIFLCSSPKHKDTHWLQYLIVFISSHSYC